MSSRRVFEETSVDSCWKSSEKVDPKVVENISSIETMRINITYRDRSNFLNLQRTKFKTITIFSVSKITPRNSPEAKKPLFPPQESQKVQQLEFYSVKTYGGQNNFSPENYVSQAEIYYESTGVPFDQMKFSERRRELKKTEMSFFSTTKKTHQSYMIKSINEVTLKTRKSGQLSR